MSKRNENRPGYRKTEVGWIPEGWEILPFSECCNIGQGQVDPTDSKYQNLPHIGPENIESNSGRILGVKTAIELGLISGKYLFDRRAIVYSKIRPNLNKLCAPWFEGLCSADCYPLWPKNENLKEYIFQFMLSPQFLKQSIPVSLRTGMPKINREDLSLLRVTLPPIPEQKKIAEILSTWDEAIDQTRKLIEAKKRRKKALMQQLLTGKRRLPGFSGKWRACSFKDYFKRIVRKNTKSCENALTISGPLGLINQEHYFKKRIAAQDLTSYYLIKKGEFAYNKSYCKGYPLGAIKMLDRYNEGVVSTLYICFRSKEGDGVHREFMKYYFESGVFNKELYSIAQEGARNHGLLNVNAQDFFATKLLLPLKDEQIAITDLLTTVGKEIKTLEQKLAALEKQKRGLMQKLLTGEVRVRI